MELQQNYLQITFLTQYLEKVLSERSGFSEKSQIHYINPLVPGIY